MKHTSAWVSEISTRLRLTRAARNFTLSGVSNLSGISTAGVGRLEKPVDGSNMSLESVVAVSNALGVPPGIMLGDRAIFIQKLTELITEALSPYHP